MRGCSEIQLTFVVPPGLVNDDLGCQCTNISPICQDTLFCWVMAYPVELQCQFFDPQSTPFMPKGYEQSKFLTTVWHFSASKTAPRVCLRCQACVWVELRLVISRSVLTQRC